MLRTLMLLFAAAMVVQPKTCGAGRCLFWSLLWELCASIGQGTPHYPGRTFSGGSLAEGTKRVTMGAGDMFGAVGFWDGAFDFTISDTVALALLSLAIGLQSGCLGLCAWRRSKSGLDIVP